VGMAVRTLDDDDGMRDGRRLGQCPILADVQFDQFGLPAMVGHLGAGDRDRVISSKSIDGRWRICRPRSGISAAVFAGLCDVSDSGRCPACRFSPYVQRNTVWYGKWTVCPLLTGSLQYLKSAFITGAMIEHFGLIGQEITTTEPQQAVMNALLDLQPTTPPKIILFKGWPQTFSWQTLAKSPMTYAEQVKEARTQIIFPLACFLAVAQPYWYFDYSWGYAEPDAGVLTYQTDADGGQEQPLALDPSWYPEFFKSLGAPTGPATKNSNGTQYSRQFAHASVTCDVGTPQNSSITWSSSQN
jgi:hypothetical protein